MNSPEMKKNGKILKLLRKRLRNTIKLSHINFSYGICTK